MKFEAKNIAPSAKMAAANVGQMATITKCVKVSASDDKVAMTCTDLVSWVTSYVEASVSEAGVSYVDAADFHRSASGGAVSVSRGADGLEISSRGKVVLSEVVGELPPPPDTKDASELIGGSDTFLDLCKFADTRSSVEMLQGVSFMKDYAFAGTGTVYVFKKCPGGNGQTIPSSARSAMRSGGRLFIGDGAWRFEADGVKSYGLNMHQPARDLVSMVPDNPVFAEFDADEALSAIDASALGRADWCVVSFSGDGAVAVGDRFGGRHADTSVPFRCEVNADATILFDVKQISSVLSFYSGSVLRISCGESLIKIEPVGGDGFAILGALRDIRVSMPVFS